MAAGRLARRGRKRGPMRRATGATLALLAIVGVLAVSAAAFSPLAGVASAHAAAPQTTLTGRVLSGGMPLASTPVTLYRTAPGGSGTAIALGSSQTRADGSFDISYRPPRDSSAVLYLIAGRGAAVRLAAVLGPAPAPGAVVVNERTTVAAGLSLAHTLLQECSCLYVRLGERHISLLPALPAGLCCPISISWVSPIAGSGNSLAPASAPAIPIPEKQICPICVLTCHLSKTAASVPIGGSLRGYTKTRITLRDG